MTPEEEKRLLATVLRTDMSAPRAPSVNMMAGQQSGTSGPYMTTEQLAAATRSTAGKELGLKNQLVQANALRGAEAAKGKTVGPYDLYMGPNWGDMAASVGKQLTGGYMAGQAGRGLDELDKEKSVIGLEQATAEQDRLKFEDKLAAESVDYQKGRDAAADAAEAARLAYEKLRDEKSDKADAARLAWEKKESELERINRLAIQKLKQKDDESGFWTPKTAKERETFDKGGEKATNTQALLNSYQDDYSAPESVRIIPGGATLDDWYNRTLGDDEGTKAAQWWSDKERRELQPRHELFGSAFTAPEQKAYDATTFKKSDSPQFIRAQLTERLRLERLASEETAAKYLMNGANPKTIMMNFGDVVDVEQLIADMESGAFDERVAARKAAARDGKVWGAPGGDEDSTDDVPAGVDPEDWKYMSDTEKALFR